MKNLKTYEEFDYSGLLPFAYYGIGLLISKLGIKYLDNKRSNKRFKEMMSMYSFTEGKWEMTDKNNIITLSKSKTFLFLIDKNKRTFEYKSDLSLSSFKVKLDKINFDKLIDGIDFVKNINDSIRDCFYDLEDDGYNVKLGRIDFSKKSFCIEITKSISDQEDIDDEDYYDHDGGYPTKNNISLDKISVVLDDCLYRITNQYNVAIYKGYKEEFSIRMDDQKLYSYSNGVILLANGENYDVNKSLEENRNYIPYNINSLTIPFIKK